MRDPVNGTVTVEVVKESGILLATYSCISGYTINAEQLAIRSCNPNVPQFVKGKEYRAKQWTKSEPVCVGK